MAHRFVPNALRTARLAASLTQHELALAAGVRIDVIARAEQGRHVPSAASLAAIALALDSPMEDFFESAEVPA